MGQPDGDRASAAGRHGRLISSIAANTRSDSLCIEVEDADAPHDAIITPDGASASLSPEVADSDFTENTGLVEHVATH